MSNFNRIITVTLILVLVGGLAFVAVNYNGRINSMSEKLDSRKQEITSLTEKVNEQESKIDNLQETTTNIDNKLANSVEELEGQIVSEDESLESELESIKEQTTTLVDKLDSQGNKINSLREENSSLKEKVNSLETTNNEQESRIEELQEENTRLENRVEKLNEKISSTNQALESTMSDLREKYLTTDEFQSLKAVVVNQGDTLSSLQAEVDELSRPEGTVQITPLKIGYVNATEAFTVFTDAVSEEREKAKAKDEELRGLREKAIQGEISEEEYKNQSITLQAEKLKAQLAIDLAMIDKMIEAQGFQEVSDRLKQLRDQVTPIMDELDSVLENLKSGSAIPEDEQTLSQINNQYQQLDDLLTRLIESKIFQITNVEARDEGYDLVLRQENVLLYRDGNTVDDLTDMTKQALRRDLGV